MKTSLKNLLKKILEGFKKKNPKEFTMEMIMEFSKKMRKGFLFKIC